MISNVFKSLETPLRTREGNKMSISLNGGNNEYCIPDLERARTYAYKSLTVGACVYTSKRAFILDQLRRLVVYVVVLHIENECTYVVVVKR